MGQRTSVSQVGGLLLGMLLIPLSIKTLWWSENRANITDIARTAVVLNDVGEIGNYNGELVAIRGAATSEEALGDPAILKQTYSVLGLKRQVEMFAWTKKGSGKNATYTKAWERVPQQLKDGVFENPKMQYESASFRVKMINFAGLEITSDSMAFNFYRPLPVEPNDLEKGSIHNGYVYLDLGGGTPEEPIVGDHRIKYFAAPFVDSGVIYGQAAAKTLFRYVAKGGEPLFRLFDGDETSAQATLDREHATLSWILRTGAWALLFLGLSWVFVPFGIWGRESRVGSVLRALDVWSALVIATGAAAAIVYANPIFGKPESLIGSILAATLFLALVRSRISERREYQSVQLGNVPVAAQNQVPGIVSLPAVTKTQAHTQPVVKPATREAVQESVAQRERASAAQIGAVHSTSELTPAPVRPESTPAPVQVAPDATYTKSVAPILNLNENRPSSSLLVTNGEPDPDLIDDPAQVAVITHQGDPEHLEGVTSEDPSAGDPHAPAAAYEPQPSSVSVGRIEKVENQPGNIIQLDVPSDDDLEDVTVTQTEAGYKRTA